MGQFYGKYRVEACEDCEDEYGLLEDFAFLRDDGLLVISPKGSHVNGANIPSFLWPLVGHPLEGGNKYWSTPHDSGYRNTVIILDLNRLPGNFGADQYFETWRVLAGSMFVHRADCSRKFFDVTLLQAMKAKGEPLWKRRTVYRAVRMFGGWCGWQEAGVRKQESGSRSQEAGVGKQESATMEQEAGI